VDPASGSQVAEWGSFICGLLAVVGSLVGWLVRNVRKLVRRLEVLEQRMGQPGGRRWYDPPDDLPYSRENWPWRDS
jgi:hypothetical protein